jgi:hypothetical protein
MMHISFFGAERNQYVFREDSFHKAIELYLKGERFRKTYDGAEFIVLFHTFSIGVNWRKSA